jgi:hypothetical protein
LEKDKGNIYRLRRWAEQGSELKKACGGIRRGKAIFVVSVEERRETRDERRESMGSRKGWVYVVLKKE